MSLLNTGRRGVFLLRPTPTIDRRGDTAADFTNPLRTEILGAWVQQVSSLEQHDDRQVVVTRWVLFCTRQDLRASDRIEWRGRLFEVDGAPNLVENASGYHHTEATLILLGAS